MKTLRTLRISVKGLFAHKVKATLALASIAGGVAAVIVTGAIGAGAKERVIRETAEMGTNLLVVRPAEVGISAARSETRGVVTSLTLDDYGAITQLPWVAEAAPGFENSETVKSGDTAVSATVLGTTMSYLDVCRFRLRFGRFVTDDDNLFSLRVAVLGARINEMLFGERNSVGRQILLRGIPFEVVGVLNAKGVLADGSDEDDSVVIPIRTALRRVFNDTWLNPIFVSVGDVSKMDDVGKEIAELLRERHGLTQPDEPDDFSIQNKTKILATQENLAETFTLLATGLAMASLVVGGVGVLALMLMAVKERTTEIGLRMAVGAKPRDILAQFLLESVGLSAGGWLLGAVLGTAAAAIVARTTAWRIAIPAELLFMTLGVMAGSGFIFGAYPAYSASRMTPIIALRME
jgi:putative ABC transport system permease protein